MTVTSPLRIVTENMDPAIPQILARECQKSFMLRAWIVAGPHATKVTASTGPKAEAEYMELSNMTITDKTVREIALEQPSSIRVFEHFGIDYCCGGRRPIAEACAAKGIETSAVIAALEKAAEADGAPVNNWATQSLTALITQIVDVHHAYCRNELPRLATLAERVVRRHGGDKPELLVIQAKLAQLSEELTEHIAKEEVVLFPYVKKLQCATVENTPEPQSCFGSVENPVAMMMREHDAAGVLMGDIRELSRGFTPPIGACPTFHAFYSGLHEFELDLHQHVHLENNILFPRAIEMESTVVK